VSASKKSFKVKFAGIEAAHKSCRTILWMDQIDGTGWSSAWFTGGRFQDFLANVVGQQWEDEVWIEPALAPCLGVGGYPIDPQQGFQPLERSISRASWLRSISDGRRDRMSSQPGSVGDARVCISPMTHTPPRREKHFLQKRLILTDMGLGPAMSILNGAGESKCFAGTFGTTERPSKPELP
jgi:hypothetical protein